MCACVMLGKENTKTWFAELNVDMDKVSLQISKIYYYVHIPFYKKGLINIFYNSNNLKKSCTIKTIKIIICRITQVFNLLK